MTARAAHFCFAGVAFLIGFAPGCSLTPKSTTTATSFVPTKLIAVAPPMNLSGSRNFDPIRLADLMRSELDQFEGVNVIEVNRVLATLNAMKSRPESVRPEDLRIRSAEEALAVADALGADGILVFAITEYDPYDPPTMGISAQIYGRNELNLNGAFDPVQASRQSAMTLTEFDAKQQFQPQVQVQRVFRAAHQDVLADVKAYGDRRNARKNAYGWRKYVVSQEDYFRYCCHAVIRDLIGTEYPKVLANAEDPKDEERRP